MQNETKEKAGDVVKCRIYFNGFAIDRDGILTERVKTRGFAGWYVDVETGDNGVKSMFSPDADSRLDYRIIN